MDELTRYKLRYFYDELIADVKSKTTKGNKAFYFNEVSKIVSNGYYYECYEVIKRILKGNYYDRQRISNKKYDWQCDLSF